MGYTNKKYLSKIDIYECHNQVYETDYFTIRGIDEQTIEDFNLGYASQVVTRSDGKEITADFAIIPTSDKSFVARNTDKNCNKDERLRHIGTSDFLNKQTLLDKEEKRPVFLVEGEFDALSIIQEGYRACALGGASNVMNFIKYINKIRFKGAFIIMTDKDQAGDTAEKTLKAAFDALKITYITKKIPDPHKDANDFLIATLKNPPFSQEQTFYEFLGNTQEEIINIQEDIKNNNLMNSIRERIDDEYNFKERFKEQYIVKNNMLYRPKGEDYIKLCDFVPYVSKIVTKNNELFYKIKCVDYKGIEQNEITVNPKTRDFADCSWIHDFNNPLVIFTGRYIKNYITEALQISAQYKDVVYEKIYNTLDYIKVDDKDVFLHCAGSINAENIKVEINDHELENYYFTPLETDQKKLKKISINLLRCYSLQATLPLTAYAFLTPLNYFLKKLKIEPKFFIYLTGEPQAGKTTLASLILNYFGPDFTESNFPAAFKDTVTSIINKATRVNNSLFLVDDFNPTNKNEIIHYTNVFKDLSSMYGDRKSRARAVKGGTNLEYKTTHGNLIMTGEFMPDVIQSRIGRGIMIYMNRSSISGEEDIYDYVNSNREKLNELMHIYIKWILLYNRDNLNSSLKELYKKYKKIFNNEKYKRFSESFTHLAIGFEMYISFLKTLDDDHKKYDKLKDIFLANLRKLRQENNLTLDKKDPAVIFLSEFSSLVESKELFLYKTYLNKLEDRDCGYEDKEFYYIFFSKTYRLIREKMIKSGIETIPKQDEIIKLLVEKEVIPKSISGIPKIKCTTRIEGCGSSPPRVMWLSKEKNQALIGSNSNEFLNSEFKNSFDPKELD